MEDTLNYLLQHNGDIFPFRVSHSRAVYKGNYSSVYKVYLSDRSQWAALKIFFDGVQGHVDARAAATYVGQAQQLQRQWPENGLVWYPRIFYDLSRCGVVIMEWVDARSFADNVRHFPASNSHLYVLTRMAAMWLRNFHSALAVQQSRDSEIPVADVYKDIKKYLPTLLSDSRVKRLEEALARKMTEVQSTCDDRFIQRVHGDFGIHNLMIGDDKCYGIDFTWNDTKYTFVDVAFFLNSLHRKLLFKGWLKSNNFVGKLTRNFVDVYDCGKTKEFSHILSIFQLHEALVFFENHKSDHNNVVSQHLFRMALKNQVNYLFDRICKFSSLDRPGAE